MVRENQQTAEPEDKRNEHRSEKFGQRVRKVIAAVDAIESSTRGIDKRIKALTQFMLGIEAFNHTQT